MGVPRVVPGVAIPYPLGDPAQSGKGEQRIRRAILRTAIDALSRDVTGPTLFPVKPDAGD
jgi:glycine reductase